LQRPQDAADSYTRALKYNANHIGATMYLGLVNVELAHLDDAVKYTRRAVELDPESATAHSNLGVTLDASGNYPEAEQEYRRSLEINPSRRSRRSISLQPARPKEG
jgi:tetratricopeptide (TPR) repeat protein